MLLFSAIALRSCAQKSNVVSFCALCCSRHRENNERTNESEENNECQQNSSTRQTPISAVAAAVVSSKTDSGDSFSLRCQQSLDDDDDAKTVEATRAASVVATTPVKTSATPIDVYVTPNATTNSCNDVSRSLAKRVAMTSCNAGMLPSDVSVDMSSGSLHERADISLFDFSSTSALELSNADAKDDSVFIAEDTAVHHENNVHLDKVEVVDNGQCKYDADDRAVFIVVTKSHDTQSGSDNRASAAIVSVNKGSGNSTAQGRQNMRGTVKSSTSSVSDVSQTISCRMSVCSTTAAVSVVDSEFQDGAAAASGSRAKQDGDTSTLAEDDDVTALPPDQSVVCSPNTSTSSEKSPKTKSGKSKLPGFSKLAKFARSTRLPSFRSRKK